MFDRSIRERIARPARVLTLSFLALAITGTYSLASEGGGDGGAGGENVLLRPSKVSKPKAAKKVRKQKPAASSSRKSRKAEKAKKSKRSAQPAPRRAAAKPVTRRPRCSAQRTTNCIKPQRTAARSRPSVPSGMPPEGESRFREEQVIVRYYLDANQGEMDALVGRLGLRHLAARTFQLAGITAHLYAITDGSDVRTVIAALEADGNVAASQPNYIYTLQQGAGSNDSQYALKKFSIDSVHALTRGGAVPVAVIDSGIDKGHPELASTKVEVIDTTETDKFVADRHGTSVAGIIAAQGALRGMAPDVRLIGVRAFEVDEKSGVTQSTTWQILEALDSSFKAGARIINMSFAGPNDPMVGQGISGAQDRRMIAVAAAGNEGPDAKPVFPAAYPGVIAVTAIDKGDAVYGNANRGDYVALAAPGVDILAPIPNGGYDISSGTSLAAAHISGLVALMLSQQEDLSASSVKDILDKSSVDLGEPGKDPVFGAGLPDAQAAIGAAGS